MARHTLLSPPRPLGAPWTCLPARSLHQAQEARAQGVMRPLAGALTCPWARVQNRDAETTRGAAAVSSGPTPAPGLPRCEACHPPWGSMWGHRGT